MPVDLTQLGPIISGLKTHEQQLARMVADIEAMQADITKLKTVAAEVDHLETKLQNLQKFKTDLNAVLEGLKKLGA